ncbi:Kynurenine formamidase [Roseibaca ekhonensis]|uniref:Kynurenine formamidase n=1 Tax=Roseinatronobacter ekhonensis TaxID=254356 RepID=A0A3B0MDY0_9RHOB|nr:cyclase family protein [Roseibaca ekhonensis]SUZ34095.1 Kynurenine formamidase [Roseibaca ekhonensis]
MGQRFVDLSMPVHQNMKLFPRIAEPKLVMKESWEEFAIGIGAGEYGEDHLTAHFSVTLSDHAGTHIDSLKHMGDENTPGPEGIPLEYCFGDGVVLDFRHLEFGSAITLDDLKGALAKINYTLKPRDIVLIQTGASEYNDEDRYLTDHVGMSAEATKYLIENDCRVTGIDAPTYDPPVWAMFETKKFWLAHKVMQTDPYWHIENLTNLKELPSHGFKLSVFPIKWVGTTGAPVRAVAILDD